MLASEDASGVGGPNLVGSFNSKTSKSIRRDRSAVVAISRCHSVLGTLTCEEALCTHETRDAVASARAADYLSQPWAAIGLSMIAVAGTSPCFASIQRGVASNL